MQEDGHPSLEDMIALLEREIERLQVTLETIRLTNHPERTALIRRHIDALDERQDALDQMKASLTAMLTKSTQSDASH